MINYEKLEAYLILYEKVNWYLLYVKSFFMSIIINYSKIYWISYWKNNF